MQPGQTAIIKSGYHELDAFTGGFHEGEAILIGARASVGKTALAGSLALRLALNGGVSSLLVTLEQPRVDLCERMGVSLAEVDLLRVRNGDLRPFEIAKIADAARRLKPLPIYFDDKSKGLREVTSAIRLAKIHFGVRLAIVDYIQLIGSSEQRRMTPYERVTEASRALKLLARDVEMPVIVLSQLNREVDGEPELVHLKESGSLEQDADLVLLLWSAECHTIVNVKIAKQRSGPKGTLQLRFEKQYARFEDLAPPASMFDVNGHA
jgi:replicative DNA helicase